MIDKPLIASALLAALATIAGCQEANTTQTKAAMTPKAIDPVAQAASRYSVSESSYGHAETLQRLYEALDRRDLTVFASVDHTAGASSVDLELNNATVVIFGSPRIGTSLMQAVPLLSAELPLRAAVYVDGDGVTKVATTSVTALGRDYPLLEDQAGKLQAISGNLAALRAEAAGADN